MLGADVPLHGPPPLLLPLEVLVGVGVALTWSGDAQANETLARRKGLNFFP